MSERKSGFIPAIVDSQRFKPINKLAIWIARSKAFYEATFHAHTLSSPRDGLGQAEEEKKFSLKLGAGVAGDRLHPLVKLENV